MKKYYGYMRVSTDQQSHERQQQFLDKWAEENLVNMAIYADFASGKNFDRPKYQELKETIKEGDVLVIKELDRLGRNWDENKEEYKWFTDRNVTVVIGDMPLLSNANQGAMSLDMKLINNIIIETMCYFAQKEREKISQRTKEALKVRKARGVKLGRKANEERNEKIMTLALAGKKPSEISEELNCSVQHVYRVINKEYVHS